MWPPPGRVALALVACAAAVGAITPCKKDGSSLDCGCANRGLIQVVNCGFGNFTTVPTSTVTWEAQTQSRVKEFYLFKTQITRISSGDLTSMVALQTLNFRESQVADIANDAFVTQTNLLELNLEGNRLETIGTPVFRTLSRLIFLRLGSNQLHTIVSEAFSGLVSLELLRLENNGMGVVPPLVLPALSELHLHRNNFTELAGGVFDGLPSIRTVNLRLNPELRDIAAGVFNTSVAANATAVVGLMMEGAQSACTKNGTGQVVCDCAEGYEHQDGHADTCGPKDCGATIPDFDVNAVGQPCTQTTYQSTCVAACRLGFAAVSNTTTPTTFTCGRKGEWEGALECSPVACPSSIPLNSTTHIEASVCLDRRFGGAPCNVSCESGFVPAGTGTGSFACGTDGQWTIDPGYVCGRARCPNGTGAIVGLDHRASQTSCPAQNGSSVTVCNATCNPGSSGIPRTYFCDVTGRWVPGDANQTAGLAINCAGTPCNRSGPALADPNAVAFCRGDTTFGGDECIVSCRPGYVPVGRASGGGGSCGGDECATCGANGQWTVSTLTCQPVQCPTSLANEMQALNRSGLVEPVSCSATAFSSECSVSCIRGYSPRNVPFRCDVTGSNRGVWFGEIFCERVDCGRLSSFPFDPRATLVESRSCAAGAEFDPALGVCSNTTIFDAAAPPRRALRCLSSGGYFVEDRTVECTADGWALAPSAVPAHAGLNISSFCRLGCGSTVPTNGANFEQCSGDLGVGATCSPRCVGVPSVTATFSCSSSGEWVETTSTAVDCVAPPTPPPTQLVVAAAGGEGSNVGLDVLVIVIPIIAVILLVLVVLYFFGYLRCVGLAYDMKRPGTKGTVKKGAFRASITPKVTTMNPAFDTGAIAVHDDNIYGSVATNFPTAARATTSEATQPAAAAAVAI